MTIELGVVEAIFRYPVKSMAGEQLESASAGWHGIEGDRRLALRRVNDRSGFPWLSASKLPELILFNPLREEGDTESDLPTHVRTPDGRTMDIFGDELAVEVERLHKAPVQMMHLRDGIFDAASMSVIATDTIEEIGKVAGKALDIRRFRPNIVVRLVKRGSFQEDSWLGGTLVFGDVKDGVRISVNMRDERCSMINLDPDSGHSSPGILKAVVRMNDNNAGVYGSVVRTGRVGVGQTVSFLA
jgi:hypothetical protein